MGAGVSTLAAALAVAGVPTLITRSGYTLVRTEWTPHPIISLVTGESCASFKTTLTVIQPHVAGLDIRAHEIWAAVPAACAAEPLRCFGTFTRIARVVYHLLKHGVAYESLSATGYDQQWQDRELTALKKKAAKLGFSLTAHPS